MFVLLAAILISPLNLLVVLYFVFKYKDIQKVSIAPEKRNSEVEKEPEKDNNVSEDKNNQIARELLENPNIIDEWFNGPQREG